MTLPDERYRAVDRTRQLLLNLINPAHTPRVPKIIREEASYCLRHFPTTFDMAFAAEACPEVFQERMEDVTRMFKVYEQSKAEKNAT
jgi:hypothetical protein